MFKLKYAKITITAPLKQESGFLFPNFSIMKNAIVYQENWFVPYSNV